MPNYVKWPSGWMGFKNGTAFCRACMWHNSNEIVSFGVDHVEPPHEGISKHEKVRWTLCETDQTLCYSRVGRGLNKVVFWVHLYPMVLNEQVDVWKETRIAL